jgi:hypothetical protein
MAMPYIAAAAGATTTKTLKDLIGVVVGYFNIALAVIMGVAVVMFVFYVVKYFITPNDQRTEAAQYVLWSLVGFFIIFSMWGLVNILKGTFNLDQTQAGSWTDYFNMFPK